MKKFFYLLTFTLICSFLASNSIANSILTSNTIDNNVSNTNQCTVNFDFDGLQVLAFGNPKQVSDGILDVIHHTPQIQIKKAQAGKTEVINTIKAEQLKDRVLNINIPNNGLNPSRYYSSDMNKDTSDFRWCLDMENDIFQKQLYLKEDKLFYKIRFNVGQFYTNNLSPDKYQFIAGETLSNFNRQIGEPGAKVELHKQDKLEIVGLDKLISLPYENGVSYQISVTNLPPKNMMSMDHFAYYYGIIKDENIPKYMPVMVQKSTYFPRPVLCSAITLSKSKID